MLQLKLYRQICGHVYCVNILCKRFGRLTLALGIRNAHIVNSISRHLIVAYPVRRRFPDVQDYRAKRYFERLAEFLGEHEIEARLARLARQLGSASGFYLQEWIIPRQSWWIGLKEAMEMIAAQKSFRRQLTPLLEPPFQTALKLSHFHRLMPDWRKDEIRSRLLHDEYPDDVLFELDTSFHYYSLGYDIEWIETRSDDAIQTAEFFVKFQGISIEVECKSKEADAGRKIERAAFYRFADRLLPQLQTIGLMGSINLTIPARLPRDEKWQEDTARTLENLYEVGNKQVELSDGSIVKISLSHSDDRPRPFATIFNEMEPNSHPYAHHLIVGRRRNNTIANPIILRVESVRRDLFLDNVLRSLRAADDQLSGDYPGVICCRIPEIDSFEGLQQDSALANMTAKYFAEHSKDFVYAVTYISEVRRETSGNVILTDMPALIYRSNLYKGDLPADVPLTA